MEQLQVTSTKDNEKVHKLLNDLLSTDKEFQIMITVPAREQVAKRKSEVPLEEKLPSAKDLEQEVTGMIHEIGVPAHIKTTPQFRLLTAQIITKHQPKTTQRAL